jgi:hypothetical protein
VLSSSPVNQEKDDSRATVKDFFNWLVEQQPEEDKDDYEIAGEVAVSQKWTVQDLRAMSSPGNELYAVAVGAFKLKDGVVRHLREDLRKFKVVYRAADGLIGLGGGG